VFDVKPEKGLFVRDLAPGVSLDEVKAKTEATLLSV